MNYIVELSKRTVLRPDSFSLLPFFLPTRPGAGWRNTALKSRNATSRSLGKLRLYSRYGGGAEGLLGDLWLW